MAFVMASTKSLGFLTLVLMFIVAPSSATYEVEVSSEILQPGETLTLRCRITEMNIGDSFYWVKRQQTDAVHDLVSSGSVLMAGFEALGRFSLDQEREGSEFLSFLTISGVELVDSGEYGCIVAFSEHEINAEEVSWGSYATADPVKTVHMFGLLDSDIDDPEGKKVEFEDGQDVLLPDEGNYYMRCEFYGSNPVADVKVTFGEDDITELFQQEVTERIEGEPTTGNLANMNIIRNDIILTTKEPLHVTTEHRRLQLVCSAAVEGQDTPTSITITPVMAVATELECPGVVIAYSYEEDVTLTCDVTAQPPVVSAVWSWVVHGGERNETLEVGTDRVGLSAYRGEPDGDSQTFNLKFDFIAESQFHQYVLTLTDENGRHHSGKIILERDNTGASHLRAAGLSSLSHCLLAVVLLLAYIMSL